MSADTPRLMGALRSASALRMYEAGEGFYLMIFGALVGALAGLAGVALNLTVHSLETWREELIGWALVLWPAAGAYLGIAVQRLLFRDHLSHGVPDVIHAVTTGNGKLPKALMFSRLFSSSLTVGSGGAAGLEGPIVVSGAAIGSFIAQIFRFPQRRRVLMIACGTSGAVAGIFNAPLTGMIFSLEVILGEWKSRNLVPTVTAAAVGAWVSRSLMGNKIHLPHEQFDHSSTDLLAFVLLGLVCALAGWILIQSLEICGKMFSRLPISAPARAGTGGLLVGLTAWFLPDAMGEGFDNIRSYIEGNYHGTLLTIVILLIVRFGTTGFTLGSGGAGGVFGPSLFVGSSIGLLFGNLLQMLPFGRFTNPGAYALVGMAGLVGGIMSAPLTGLFLVLEISGSYNLILPLMLTVLSSMLVSRFLEDGSIYTREMIRSGSFKRRGSETQLLADVDIAEVLEPCPELDWDETLGDFIVHYGSDQNDVYALVDSERNYKGLIFFEDIRPYLLDQALYPLITMAGIADTQVPTLGANATPDMAWIAFARTHRSALPVIDGEGHCIGIVTKNALFDSARTEFSVHDQD